MELFDVENWLWKSNFSIFDTSLLSQFAKFNDFIWLQLIFSQKLSNFVSLPWKLHNRECYIVGQPNAMLKVRPFNILTLYDNFVRVSRMDPSGNFGQEAQFLRDLVNDKTKSQKKRIHYPIQMFV